MCINVLLLWYPASTKETGCDFLLSSRIISQCLGNLSPHCQPNNTSVYCCTKIDGNRGGKQYVRQREDKVQICLTTFFLSDKTCCTCVFIFHCKNAFSLWKKRKKKQLNIPWYTKVLIFICTFLPSQTNPLWINLNKSQQEIDLFGESNFEWMNPVSIKCIVKKISRKRFSELWHETKFNLFLLLSEVIQAQTCSQDFNTTRPFPILWEKKK